MAINSRCWHLLNNEKTPLNTLSLLRPHTNTLVTVPSLEIINIFLAEPKRVKLVDGEFVGDPGNTAAPAKARLGASDLWLVDTGCGHDLVSANNAKLSKGKKITLENQVAFQTANGDAPSTHSSQIFIEELSEMIEPFVLKDTPSVISVDDRTMNEGC